MVWFDPVALTALGALCAAAAPASDPRDPTPVVSRLHTLSIHVRSHATHDSIDELLAEKLKLPRTYEPLTVGGRRYAGMWAGNVVLEPCGPYPEDSYLDSDFEAMFYGLTFEPWASASASASALDARGIPHGKPAGSLRLEDPDLCAPNVYVGLGEKEPEGKRRELRLALAARDGGPIGLVRVEEIRIGCSDDRNLRKWIAFLAPAPPVGENAFRIGDGPTLRFLKGAAKRVQGITLEVRDLARAIAFLEGCDLVGRVGPGFAELDRGRTHGLGIRVEE